jgi:hypothetical protein
MYRALLTAETVANTLAPAIDLRSVGPKFFAALAFENTLRAGGLKNLQPAILEVLDQLHEYSRLFCNVAIEALSMVVPGAYCKGDS